MSQHRLPRLSPLLKIAIFLGVDLLWFFLDFLTAGHRSGGSSLVSYWLPSPTYLPGLLGWGGLLFVGLESLCGRIGLLLARCLFCGYLLFLAWFQFGLWTAPQNTISPFGVLGAILPTAGLALVIWTAFQSPKPAQQPRKRA